jgi:IS5 family transposase
MGRSSLPGPTRRHSRACTGGKGFHQSSHTAPGSVDEAERAKNRTKSKVRAKVEHTIGVIKRVFGFSKVRYRGLEKNAQRLFVTCALANLFILRRDLLRRQGA